MALYFNCYLCMGTFEGKKYMRKGEEQYTECFALLCVKQRAGWLLFSLPLVLITAFWDVCYYFCYYYAYVIDKDKKCWELSNDCKATENSSLALSAPKFILFIRSLAHFYCVPRDRKAHMPSDVCWVTDWMNPKRNQLTAPPFLWYLCPVLSWIPGVLETPYRFYRCHKRLLLDGPQMCTPPRCVSLPDVYPFQMCTPPCFLPFFCYVTCCLFSFYSP